MTYNVPACIHQAELEIKKSRFIARATVVTSREEFMLFLQEVRHQYPDARHHCWAYLLGDPATASSAAANDDGEPSGTAGKPILNVIQHKQIGDTAVVVTRYFGGVKLGAGGLVRAYSQATELVLAELPMQQVLSFIQCDVECDFAHEQPIRHFCEQTQSRVEGVRYSENVYLQLAVVQSGLVELRQLLAALGCGLKEKDIVCRR